MQIGFKNIPDSFVPLQGQVTVGSQGQTLNHSGLASHHCTFISQDEVISIVDHGSDQGTLVNGEKIPPFKMIIILATDTVNVGNQELVIKGNQAKSDNSGVFGEIDLEAGTSPGLELSQGGMASGGETLSAGTETRMAMPSLPADLKHVENKEDTYEDDPALAAEKTAVFSLEGVDLDSETSTVPATDTEEEDEFSRGASMMQKMPEQDSSGNNNFDENDPDEEERTAILSLGEETLVSDALKAQANQEDNTSDQDGADFDIVDTSGPYSMDEDDLEAQQNEESASIEATGSKLTLNPMVNDNTAPGITDKTLEVTSGTVQVLKPGKALKESKATSKEKSKSKKERTLLGVRAPKNLKSSRKVKTAVANTKVQKPRLSAEGSFSLPHRMMALVIDIIASAVIFGLVRKYGVEQMVADAYQFVLPYLEQYLPLVPLPLEMSQIRFVFPLLCVYGATRIFANLLFGKSLGQLFVLTRTSGSFLFARIAGAIREILGFAFAPFVIFEIPSILGRASVKEVLTRAFLWTQFRFLGFLGGIVGLVVVTTPLLIPLEFVLDVPNMKGSLLPASDPSIVDVLPASESRAAYNSEYFGISFRKPPREWLLLPEVALDEKTQTPKAKILALKMGTEQQVILDRKLKVVNWRKTLGEFRNRDFIFPLMYPLSNSYLNNNKNAALVAEQEIVEMSRQGISFGYQTIVDYLLSHGPYFYTPLLIREKLNSVVKSGFDDASFWRMGGERFIKLETVQAKFEKKNVSHYWYPVRLTDTPLLSFQFNSINNVQESKGFYRNFFQKLKWNDKYRFDPQSAIGVPRSFQAFELIDFLTGVRDPGLQQQLSPRATRFFKLTAKKALKLSTPENRDVIRMTLVSLYEKNLKGLIELNKETRSQTAQNNPVQDFGLDTLIRELTKDIDALKNQNDAYFGV